MDARRVIAARSALDPARPTGANRRITLEKRFMQYVQKTDDGHWIWRGARCGGKYGEFGLFGKPRRAHEVAYRMYKGFIPEGHELKLCKMPYCVHPEHTQKVGHRIAGNANEQLEAMVPGLRRLIKEREQAGQPEQHTLKSIGLQFGVTREAVRLVLTGKITGRFGFGKLSKADCQKIKQLYTGVLPSVTEQVAREFGIPPATMKNLATGKTYAWVKDEE